jgi:hypothetical protein
MGRQTLRWRPPPEHQRRLRRQQGHHSVRERGAGADHHPRTGPAHAGGHLCLRGANLAHGDVGAVETVAERDGQLGVLADHQHSPSQPVCRSSARRATPTHGVGS